ALQISREFTRAKRTLYVDYERYIPMAVKQLERIGDDSGTKWPDTLVSIAHRTGRLNISEAAVAIAVSSPHRDQAFKASRYAIELIKQIISIWKEGQWEEGTKWTGDQKETISYVENNKSAKK